MSLKKIVPWNTVFEKFRPPPGKFFSVTLGDEDSEGRLIDTTPLASLDEAVQVAMRFDVVYPGKTVAVIDDKGDIIWCPKLYEERGFTVA